MLPKLLVATPLIKKGLGHFYVAPAYLPYLNIKWREKSSSRPLRSLTETDKYR